MSENRNSVAAATAKVADQAIPQGGLLFGTLLELGALGAIWGASFLFMRVAAPSFGAAPLVVVRLSLGAAVLSPLLWRERARFQAITWLKLLGIAGVNSAAPFLLFAWAAESAPAGVGAITNSMAVLFAALIGFLLYREPIGVRRALGLAVGFLGVVVLASGKTAGSSVAPAVVAGTAAAFGYGIGANLIRHHMAGIPAGALASATLTCSTLLVAPFAIALWPSHAIPMSAWSSAILLGALCTGLAFLLYYRLIQRTGATRAASVTYLIPLFGMLWAWMVLGETPTIGMGVAAGLILGGVALSQARPASRP